jgi:hypothetical protein
LSGGNASTIAPQALARAATANLAQASSYAAVLPRVLVHAGGDLEWSDDGESDAGCEDSLLKPCCYQLDFLGFFD